MPGSPRGTGTGVVTATGAGWIERMMPPVVTGSVVAVIAETDQLFEAFEFGKVCDVLYHFAWDEVCDWYLELAKVPLSSILRMRGTWAKSSAAIRRWKRSNNSKNSIAWRLRS